MDYGPLFQWNAELGEGAKDAALARVSSNAGPKFMEAARAVILDRLSGQEVLAEEMRRICEEVGVRPHHHNAWGSLTNQLVKAGVLKDTGRLAKSNSVRSHRRRQPVWKVR